MKKIDELEKGCMSRALDDEMTFVLLARDAVAPNVIRFWANERVRLGLNDVDDPQIREAFECAALMESQRDKIKARKS